MLSWTIPTLLVQFQEMAVAIFFLCMHVGKSHFFLFRIYLVCIVLILLVSLLFFSFLFDHFYIPVCSWTYLGLRRVAAGSPKMWASHLLGCPGAHPQRPWGDRKGEWGQTSEKAMTSCCPDTTLLAAGRQQVPWVRAAAAGKATGAFEAHPT